MLMVITISSHIVDYIKDSVALPWSNCLLSKDRHCNLLIAIAQKQEKLGQQMPVAYLTQGWESNYKISPIAVKY